MKNRVFVYKVIITMMALLSVLSVVVVRCSSSEKAIDVGPTGVLGPGGGDDGSTDPEPDPDPDPEPDPDTNIIEITDEAGLKAMEIGCEDCSYKLMNDIALQEDWEPIGTSESQFMGTLNGNDKTITGLRIEELYNHDIGFFAYMGEGSEVSNLTLQDVYVKGKNNVGALAANSRGSIIGVKVELGEIGFNKYIGGLVGHLYGTIENSYSSATVKGDICIGGLVGQSYNGSSIISSYTTGNVEGNKYIGGLVGLLYGTVGNSYSSATVKGDYPVGGLVGRSDNSSSITNSYATGKVEGGTIYVGGLAGKLVNNSIIENSYFDIMATGQTIGVGNNSLYTGVTGVSEVTNIEKRIDKYYDADSDTEIFIDWAFGDVWIFSDGNWPALSWQD